MGGVLALCVTGRLELEGGVLDADGEVGGHAVLELGQHLGGVAVGEALLVQDDVGGQHGQSGGDGGGVQVVHVLHVRHGDQVGADVVQVQPLGGGLQQDVAGLPQDRDCLLYTSPSPRD